MKDIIRFNGDMFKLGFKEVLNHKNLNIIGGESEGINRKAVENKQIDILMSPESYVEKDKTHQRNSGLNQILCKLANKNKVSIGFAFSEVLNSKEKGKLIGRMMQNVKLCRKYKVKMVLCSFAKNKWEMRAPKDLMSFGMYLGMDGKEVKEALNFKLKKRDIEVVE